MMKATALSRQTVHRIVNDPDAAEATLELWSEAERERARRKSAEFIPFSAA
jgi:hypothetical protein